MSDVLDLLIVGGGPFGTATAFRAKELGLNALVIDYDDLMKRIRDYAKDKQILPNFGGGDTMQFPAGGELVNKLKFGPIDKDALCAAWKALYQEYKVPARIGLEMTNLARQGDTWRVVTWNQAQQAEEIFEARHVVLAMGRGVPRRLDVTGEVQGLAFKLTRADIYVGAPACVIGGGTSAAEAVIALSGAKIAAGDESAVYWSYRSDKLPNVSQALAGPFFQALTVNGNIVQLPKSDAVSVIGTGDEAHLTVRVARATVPGRAAESKFLEFKKSLVIACIGEEIPVALLNKVGTPLVEGGPSNEKLMVLSPLLETRQPNVYAGGDLIGQAYFETRDFDSDPGGFAEIDRRGNIKAALRDGVFLAEVIKQKLEGRAEIVVNLKFAGPDLVSGAEPSSELAAPAIPFPPVPVPADRPIPSDYSLVSILAGGTEANEFHVRNDGETTIGRQGTDVVFAEDSYLSDRHASIVAGADSFQLRDEGSSRGTYLQPTPGRQVSLPASALIKVGEQWLMVGDRTSPGTLVHYDATGKALGRFELREGTSVVGRQSPDITLTTTDHTLSRRHAAFHRRGDQIMVQDLGGANGTVLRVRELVTIAAGDRILVGQQVLKFRDERAATRPGSSVSFDTTSGSRAGRVSQPAIAKPAVVAPAAPKAPTPPAPVPAPAPTGEPSIFVRDKNKNVPYVKGETLYAAMERAKVGTWHGCQMGECGACPLKILDGGEAFGPILPKERRTLKNLRRLEAGPYRLACMSRITGPIQVEVVPDR